MSVNSKSSSSQQHQHQHQHQPVYDDVGLRKSMSGICPICDTTRTHERKSFGLLWRQKPLTIEGVVYKGHCLNCHEVVTNKDNGWVEIKRRSTARSSNSSSTTSHHHHHHHHHHRRHHGGDSSRGQHTNNNDRSGGGRTVKTYKPKRQTPLHLFMSKLKKKRAVCQICGEMLPQQQQQDPQYQSSSCLVPSMFLRSSLLNSKDRGYCLNCYELTSQGYVLKDYYRRKMERDPKRLKLSSTSQVPDRLQYVPHSQAYSSPTDPNNNNNNITTPSLYHTTTTNNDPHHSQSSTTSSTHHQLPPFDSDHTSTQTINSIDLSTTRYDTDILTPLKIWSSNFDVLAITNLIRQNKLSPLVCVDAFHTLRHFPLESDRQVSCTVSALVRVVVEAMEKHRRQLVRYDGMGTAGDDDNMDETSGACSLNAHALAVLWRVSCINFEAKWAVAKLMGTSVILKTLLWEEEKSSNGGEQQGGLDNDVILMGCGALSSLFRVAKIRRVMMMSQSMPGNDVVSFLVRVVRRRKIDLKVTEWALRAMYNFSVDRDICCDMRKEDVRDIVDAIEGVFVILPNVPKQQQCQQTIETKAGEGTQAWALRVLLNLASCHVLPDHPHLDPVVLALMKQYPQNDSIQSLSLGMLSHIMISDNALWNVSQLISSAMERFPHDRRIQERGCSALIHLCRHQPRARMTILASSATLHIVHCAIDNHRRWRLLELACDLLMILYAEENISQERAVVLGKQLPVVSNIFMDIIAIAERYRYDDLIPGGLPHNLCLFLISRPTIMPVSNRPIVVEAVLASLKYCGTTSETDGSVFCDALALSVSSYGIDDDRLKRIILGQLDLIYDVIRTHMSCRKTILSAYYLLQILAYFPRSSSSKTTTTRSSSTPHPSPFTMMPHMASPQLIQTMKKTMKQHIWDMSIQTQLCATLHSLAIFDSRPAALLELVDDIIETLEIHVNSPQLQDVAMGALWAIFATTTTMSTTNQNYDVSTTTVTTTTQDHPVDDDSTHHPTNSTTISSSSITSLNDIAIVILDSIAMNRDNDRVMYQAFGLLSQLSLLSNNNNKNSSSSSSSSVVPSLRLLPSFAKHLTSVISSSPERLQRSTHKRLRLATISLIAAWAEDLAKHKKSNLYYVPLVVGVAELVRVCGAGKTGNDDDDDVVCRAIYALKHLCGDDNESSSSTTHIKTQIVCKAFDHIMKIMDRYVVNNDSDDDDDAAAVVVIHETLGLIAKLESVCSLQLLKNENVVNRIINVTQRYPDHLSIQEHAVSILASIMWNDKSANVITITDKFAAARHISSTMANHPGSSLIIKHGCYAISSLIASHYNNNNNLDNNDDNDDSSTSIITKSFLPTTGSIIINGMQCHISNPHVQTAALLCLYNLTNHPPSPLRSRRTMTTCRAAASRSSCRPKARDVIRQSGGHAAILLSMQVHFKRPEIQRLAFQVLTNINVDLEHCSSNSSSNDDEIDDDNNNDDAAVSPDESNNNSNNITMEKKKKANLLDPKELDAIVTALKIHHRHPVIQYNAFVLLTYYGGEESNVWIMCENHDLENYLDSVVTGKRDCCTTPKVIVMVRGLLDKMKKMQLMMTMENLTVTS